MITRDELRVRDPFVLTDFDHGCYYLCGTLDLLPDSIGTHTKFSVCKTYDLENFEEHKVIFDGSGDDFWATYDFWAPEIHKYKGKYYLFGSVKAKGKCRGTQIFVCDTPDGQYRPLSDYPVTPSDWECLDGTLFVDGDIPYMVFCHEWTQVGDGEICAIQLSDDLSRAVGEPFVLFKATDNPSVTELLGHPGCYVTDGPFLYREDGKIKMIWSSFENGMYLVLGAESDSIRGKWTHTGSKFDFDGGHAMIFTTLEGRRMIVLHSPNRAGQERAVYYDF